LSSGNLIVASLFVGFENKRFEFNEAKVVKDDVLGS